MKRLLFSTVLLITALVAAFPALAGRAKILLYKDSGYVGDWTGSSTVLRIYNPNDYALTDYQVKVPVPEEMKGKNFCIALAESGQNIPYCFEQSNGECGTTQSSTAWVKVPQLPSRQEVTVQFEENPNCGPSPGDEVFAFYEDFSTLNTEKWTFQESLSDFSIVSGWLHVLVNSTLYKTAQSQMSFGTGYAVKLAGKFYSRSPVSSMYCLSVVCVCGVKLIAHYGGCAGQPHGTVALLKELNADALADKYIVGTVSDDTDEAGVRVFDFSGSNALKVMFYPNGSITVVVKGKQYQVSGTASGYPAFIREAKNAGEIVSDYVMVRKLADLEPEVRN